MRPIKKTLAMAIGLAIAGPAAADPPANVDLPDVFCFRITDIERVAGDAEKNRFLFEFEVLNWTDTRAAGVRLDMNIGTSPGVTIAGASIDADGRGGPNDTAFDNIGNANPDPTAPSHQSGRGRSDISDHLNDWGVLSESSSSVTWSALDSAGNLDGTQIPNQDLLFSKAGGQVPGTGLDALGDTAIDGGPAPYTVGPQDTDPQVAKEPPDPDGSGNVLDGFVIDIDDFDEGETLSFNWFLLGFEAEVPSFTAAASAGCDNIANCLEPIGTSAGGNSFGFGLISLARIGVGDELPGGLFEGNTGFNQSGTDFFGNVFDIPNPTEFGGEFGAGLTAQFLNPRDNVFGAQPNTSLKTNQTAPEPTTASTMLAGLAGMLGLVGWRRRRRKP